MTRYTAGQWASARAMYERGDSIAAIACETGIRPSTVRCAPGRYGWNRTAEGERRVRERHAHNLDGHRPSRWSPRRERIRPQATPHHPIPGWLLASCARLADQHPEVPARAVVEAVIGAARGEAGA